MSVRRDPAEARACDRGYNEGELIIKDFRRRWRNAVDAYVSPRFAEARSTGGTFDDKAVGLGSAEFAAQECTVEDHAEIEAGSEG